MAGLVGQDISATFDSLLTVECGEPLTGVTKYIVDGLGNRTQIKVSTDEVELYNTTFHGPVVFDSG
ncbi:hypothetical protein, partial [Enterococcus faecium]|uniref:hypothetical protein n=1 Tax=Enterococcus faecium TaxID=1352 RepID=UPI003DA102C1